jgi:hypothetical protein
MTISIARRGGGDGEGYFEIERVLAIGWVRGNTEVEEEWAEGVDPE